MLRPLISVSKLLGWYDVHKSDYPWGRSAYQVWVSEIMLQQTVAATVVSYYLKWVNRYPDIVSLAGAADEEVVALWEGLGYYNRVRNMLKTARILTETRDGNFPQSYKELLKLPGIGDYTARAILSLAFGKPFPVMDANVFRVAQRLSGEREKDKAFEKALLSELSSLIPPDRCGDFNEALMQFGQQVCSSQTPSCTICPFGDSCRALRLGITGEIPRKVKANKNKFKTFVPVLFFNGKYLTGRVGRGPGKDLNVFPGMGDSVRQEVMNILGEPPLEIGKFKHHYTSNQESLEVYLFVLKQKPELLPFYEEKHYSFRWLTRDELKLCPMPSVYRRILGKFPKLPMVLGSYKDQKR